MKIEILLILEKVKNGELTPQVAQEQLFILFGVSNSFFKKYEGFPTVEIKRGNKTLIQQRATKESLMQHLKDKYPDWEIVQSNCC